jgi:amidase
MGKLSDVVYLDATAQADLIRKKEVKPLELVEAAIGRVEALNPAINAVITPMYAYARKAALRTSLEGPFAGVPFLLKDVLAEFAGERVTEGSSFLRDYIAREDTELVKRFKKAGFIIIGKTNTPELAVGVTTEPRFFGPTRNPWDPTRTTGGSSGGSAAAVAARMVPIAHGNDAGGSIRIPASCCGVFGLKPTRGRNPLGPYYGDVFSGLAVEHALAVSVRDSAALLDATSGPDLGDPYCAPAPARPFLQELDRDPGRLRIAFSTRTPLGSELHPDCKRAVEEAAALCAGLGHEVVDGSPAFDAELLWKQFTTVLSAGMAWSIDDWARRIVRKPAAESFEPFVWAFYQKGKTLSASEYLLAIQDLQRLTREIARFFTDHDIWLTPTLGQPPVALGSFEFSTGDAFELRRKMSAFSPFTFIANVTGQPAMSVPLYWNAEGLPVGTQFTARFGEEGTLFQLAARLEEARPWKERRPAVVP